MGIEWQAGMGKKISLCKFCASLILNNGNVLPVQKQMQ